MTIYSLDVLLFLFGTSLLFHVQFCYFLTCIQISQEAGQVVWYSHLLKNFPQFVVIYTVKGFVQFSSVAQSCPSLRPHELQHARPPCPSPTPEIYPNSCTLSRWCHPTISSFFIPFSSHFQSFPASGSFQMSQLFASGGQIIGASASLLPIIFSANFL